MTLKVGIDVRNIQGEPLPVLARANKIDLRKPLAKWGVYMLGQVNFTFEHQGRDNIKWPKLKPSTLAGRRARGLFGRKALDAAGNLKRSFRTATRGALEQVITSSDPKAKIHQEGAPIPARTVFPKNAKFLRFTVGAGPHGGGGQVIYAKKAEIPAFYLDARPMAFVTPTDQAKNLEFMRAHIIQVLRTKPGVST